MGPRSDMFKVMGDQTVRTGVLSQMPNVNALGVRSDALDLSPPTLGFYPYSQCIGSAPSCDFNGIRLIPFQHPMVIGILIDQLVKA